MSRFLAWLAREAPAGNVTEISAAQKLELFREQTGALKEISFDTISGAGPNGAIVHYRVTTATDRPLGPGELYLVDSGAQYLDGTTDVTRTVAIGTPSDEMKDRFTRVLKGHIALASARFPAGTSGAGDWGGPMTLKALERCRIADALRRQKGNRKRAAAELGIDASTLYRKIKLLDIETPPTDGRGRRR